MNVHRPSSPKSVRDRTRHARNPRRAYSLIELVLALSIASILLLAMQSAVMVAARGIPDGRSVGSRVAAGAAQLNALSSDVFYATAFSEMTANAITFTVPDTNGDGAPDTIRYAWSGNPGDPLTRQYNGGAVVNILPSIQSFNLTFDKRAVVAPMTYTTSAETLLASSNANTNLSDFAVSSANWPGQYVMPALPANANRWAITKVRLQAEVNGTTAGQSLVQIRAVDAAGLPTSTVIDQQTMLESSLSVPYTWPQFTFVNATNLDPAQGVAIVIQWVNDYYACNLQYQGAGLLGGLLSGLLGGGGNLLIWNGSSWANATGNLTFFLYGTYTTPNPPTYNYFLKDVRCTLQLTAESSTQLTTMIRTVNEPQVTGP